MITVAILLLQSAIRDPQSTIGSPQSEMTVAGSSAWQIAFFSFALVLILIEVIRGWRLGIMRQMMRVMAVAAAYATAYFGRDLLVPFLRSYLQLPDVIISALGGSILAVAVYGIVASLGTLLFQRTAQQESGTRRWVYGLSGALLGLCFGAFFIWLILVGVRLIGSIADAQVQSRPKQQHSVSAHEPALATLNTDSVTTALARLKNSVELGPVGDAVKKTDVMPTGVYQTLGEAGTVLSNPASAQRFLNFPGVREMSANPKILAMRDDPEVAKLIAEGRVMELLRHPRVIEAINDPALVEQVKKFDLKKALEYAKKN